MLYALGRLVRFIVVWTDFLVLTVVLYLLAWLPRPLTSAWYFPLFRVWCRVFVRALDVDLRLHQKNTRPLPEHYILVANHPSAFEDIGIPALFPVRSLAKIEVRDWWIVGRISIAAGTLYVQRESKDSRSAAVTEIVDALQRGVNIAVYPEGGCKGRRIFDSFRYGAFDIAIRTGIPVLPVFLHYESQDDFEWRSPQTLLDKIGHFVTTQNNRANYYLYDAIDPADFADAAEFSEHVRGLFLQWQARYLD